MPKPQPLCLTPGCTRGGKQIRGQCTPHYQMLCRQVSDGLTTYEELEKLGFLLPSERKHAGVMKSEFLDLLAERRKSVKEIDNAE